jgi:hypothetical protein
MTAQDRGLTGDQISALEMLAGYPADSEGMRPPIPTESGHPIRSKAAT